MDTLKAYLLGNYWRRTFFAPETVTTFLAALGFFWLLTEISSFIVDAWKAQLQALWMYFIAISVAYTLWVSLSAVMEPPVFGVMEPLASAVFGARTGIKNG